MFSKMNNKLKTIDFYQAVQNEHSEGTSSGGCLTLALVIFLAIMILNTVFQFLQPKQQSDLIIDQEHLTQKLKVNIDVEFPRYPCSMLSLDVESSLGIHELNIEGIDLRKHVVPGGEIYDQREMSRQAMIDQIIEDYKEKKGCRMVGSFEVDRVPGNFHFSCHGYADIIQEALAQSFQFSDMIDLTHIIHELSFGELKTSEKSMNALKNFHSQKEIIETFLGISYMYFLDIVEQTSFDLQTGKSQDKFFYTARMNQILLTAAPMVFFAYEANPMTVIKIVQHNEWHVLLVELVGMIGGIVSISIIIDSLIHSSIHFLLQKQRLGKLI